MSRPLEGQTIALAEGRQLEDLAQLLEKEGATPLRCPLISIQDAPDAGQVLAWLDDLSAGHFQLLVLMTGEALRRLLGFADRAGRRDAFVQALGRIPIITRGPKPVRALKEIGLTPALIAEAPTTAGVIATLRSQPLAGKTIGVTLYGEPNPALEQFLTDGGALVRTVMPYAFAPATDAERVVEVLRRMASGEVQFILFTSSPQVDRLFEIVEQRQLSELVRQAFEQTKVAAVGPLVADTLRQRGVRVDVCPEQGFVMKNLVMSMRRDAGSAD
jgi:uroporphyrinogen-III synthase